MRIGANDEENLKLYIRVKNIGALAGKETIQIYVSKPQTDIEKAAKELADFEKTKLLSAGESQLITVQIPKHHMTSYDEQSAAFILEAGNYTVWIGNSIENIALAGIYEISESQIIKQVVNRMIPNQEIKKLRRKDVNLPNGVTSGIVEQKIGRGHRTTLYPCKSLYQESQVRICFADVVQDVRLLETFIGQMDTETLARISVCARDGWGMDGTGEAGRLYIPEAYDLPTFVVADGNSGVNLRVKNIGMPSGATICASFNKELSKEIGGVNS